MEGRLRKLLRSREVEDLGSLPLRRHSSSSGFGGAQSLIHGSAAPRAGVTLPQLRRCESVPVHGSAARDCGVFHGSSRGRAAGPDDASDAAPGRIDLARGNSYAAAGGGGSAVETLASGHVTLKCVTPTALRARALVAEATSPAGGTWPACAATGVFRNCTPSASSSALGSSSDGDTECDATRSPPAWDVEPCGSANIDGSEEGTGDVVGGGGGGGGRGGGGVELPRVASASATSTALMSSAVTVAPRSVVAAVAAAQRTTARAVVLASRSLAGSSRAAGRVVYNCVQQSWQLLLDISNDWMQERYQLVHLRRKMGAARTYEEWAVAALKYDTVLDKVAWTLRKESPDYDADLIERRLRGLRQLRRGYNATDIAYNLRAGLHRNLGGICNPSLYRHTLVGTKVLIQDYINEVVDQLRFLACNNFSTFPLMQKLVFFRETRHAFGRTALMLSGGATLTMYHLGVVKALLHADLLPRVISGSSGGSLVAAWLCTARDSELSSRLDTGGIRLGPFEEMSVGSVRRKVTRLFKRGVLFDIGVLERFVRANIPDLTFLEAYRLTHRVLNVTVTSASNQGGDVGRLLNYLTAPNVIVSSAVLASCAIPGVYEPVELKAKDKHGNIVAYHPHGRHWVDGTIAHDLPMQRLSELFNINQFIVSQTNPWVVPFLPDNDQHVADMPWNLNGMFARAVYVAISQMRNCTELLCTLGLVPRVVRKYLALLWQRYRGDITIVPAASLGDYSRILSNPSASFIERCTVQGMRRTWPKLSFIRARCAIEQALDSGVRMLQREVTRRAVDGGGKSVVAAAEVWGHNAGSADMVRMLAVDQMHTGVGGGAASGSVAHGMRRGASSQVNLSEMSSPLRASTSSGALRQSQSPQYSRSHMMAASASQQPQPQTGGDATAAGDVYEMMVMRGLPSFPDFAALRSSEYSCESLENMHPIETPTSVGMPARTGSCIGMSLLPEEDADEDVEGARCDGVAALPTVWPSAGRLRSASLSRKAPPRVPATAAATTGWGSPTSRRHSVHGDDPECSGVAMPAARVSADGDAGAALAPAASADDGGSVGSSSTPTAVVESARPDGVDGAAPARRSAFAAGHSAATSEEIGLALVCAVEEGLAADEWQLVDQSL